jgi:probable HAF family extracellular repeat protein
MAALPTATASARWHLTDLGTLGGTFSRATAINDKGDVVGFSTPAGGRTTDPHCFLWQRGVMRDLGTLPGTTDCEPTLIDDAGTVLGSSGPEAFLWRDGHFTDLGPGEADDINAHGVVVGTVEQHAFLWHDGTRTMLSEPSPVESWADAWAILDDGTVIGDVFVKGGDLPRMRAVEWRDGRLHFLPLPPRATESNANGMNERGVIVGTVEYSTGYHTRAVTWDGKTVTVIPAPNRGDGESIDGQGDVGVLTTSGTAPSLSATSFVWSSGKLLALDRWVDFTCANHHLLAGARNHAFVWMNGKITWLPARKSAVNGCNEQDQIVGWTVVKGAKVSGTFPVHAALWSH